MHQNYLFWDFIPGIRQLLILCVLSFACISCSIVQKGSDSSVVANYCDPPHYYYSDTTFNVVPFEVIERDSVLLKKYSLRDLYLADIIGIYPYLKEIDSLKNTNAFKEVDGLRIKQTINFRITYFSSQISSISSELDCEGERTDQLAVLLYSKEQTNTKLLTIASITAAGIAGIYTSLEQEDKIVGVAGGAVSTALGLMALFPQKKVKYMHERNLLTDIWNESEKSKVYPNAIWHVLSTKYFSNEQKHPVSYNIKHRWIEYKYINDKTEDLYFGKGGLYSSGQLKIRAHMLNQLQSSVRSINQDLEALLRNIYFAIHNK